MAGDEALDALRAAFAGNDDASAAWSQTPPETKAKCITYVDEAGTDQDRQSRAREVARLAARGPIHELGPGTPDVPDYLRHGFGGLLPPHGA